MTRQASTAAARRRAAKSAPDPQIGAWRLVSLLGKGRWTWVYQAAPENADSPESALYALKTLPPGWDNDRVGLELLRHEAAAGLAASNPHLVSVLAANVAEPPYYLVMPLLQGSTLEKQLAAGHRHPLPVALWIIRQAAEALAALEAAGWTHGDVKPANLIVSADGHATLIDLGFARRQGEIVSLASRPLLGTLNYTAPELLTSSVDSDIRSDLYSLGVTMYELLSGRLPFEARDLSDLIAQHRAEEATDLRVLAPHLPVHVSRLTAQLLAKQPLRRPQTAAEVVRRLTSLEIETFGDREPL